MRAVLTHKKPAAEPLFHGVKAVTYGSLRYLRQEGLRIAQDHLPQASVPGEFGLKHIRPDRVRSPRDLRDGLMGHRVSTENQSDSQHSIASDHADFSG
jgi:hypothetical protein